MFIGCSAAPSGTEKAINSALRTLKNINIQRFVRYMTSHITSLASEHFVLCRLLMKEWEEKKKFDKRIVH